MSIVEINGLTTPKDKSLKLWAIKAPEAKNDLIINKVVITLVALCNFAALGAALYLIVTYCPIPEPAILASPFIFGVLAALANLKVTLFDLRSLNYKNYLSPQSLIGRAIAYLFFGPLIYISNQTDWTPYHDAIEVNKISNAFESHTFEKLVDEYGQHINHLFYYNILHLQDKTDFFSLYTQCKNLIKEIKYWESRKRDDKVKEAREKMAEVEEKWKDIKNTFDYPFPHPQDPPLDFSNQKSRIRLKIHSVCLKPLF